MSLAAALAAARLPAAGSGCCSAAALLQISVCKRAFAGVPQPEQQQDSNSQHSSSNTTKTDSGEGISSGLASSGSSDGYEVLYEGFFAKPHKRLKYASLLNTFASFAAAPLIISYSSASPIARVAVTTSVIAFAVITTGGLHWFTKPYVHQLLYNRQADTIRAQSLSFFGGTRWHEFLASSVTEPTGYHPLASFKVDGRTFYIDRANFKDSALMKRLMPWVLQQQEDAASIADAQQQKQQ